jgi:hypothetical protein
LGYVKVSGTEPLHTVYIWKKEEEEEEEEEK